MYTMLPSPLMSPYSFSMFAVDPLAQRRRHDAGREAAERRELVVVARCDWVKQAVIVVADVIDVISDRLGRIAVERRQPLADEHTDGRADGRRHRRTPAVAPRAAVARRGDGEP